MSDEKDEPAIDLFDDAVLDELSHRGEAIYKERLQSTLEPEHNGETVAIHLDSGDYVLAGRYTEAMRVLRERHPEGLMMARHIGPLDEDSPLARRLMRAKRPVTK